MKRSSWNCSVFRSLCLLLLCFEVFAIPGDEDNDEVVVGRFREYLQIRTDHPNPDYDSAIQFLLFQAKSIDIEALTLEFVEKKPVLLLTWRGEDSSLPTVLLNSHTDVVPAETEKWIHHPFSGYMDENGDIYARGAQDMKCVGMQYLEAIRRLKKRGFQPLRSLHVSFVPDEEIGGKDGAQKFVSSSKFSELNVGVVLDEGLASPHPQYRVFNGERSPWRFVIKAVGSPGHGSRLYDNSALENLLKSLESIARFRESQFDLWKAGLATEGEVVSVNPVYLKAGTPTPTGFVMNVQPSVAEAGIDMRVAPLSDPQALEKRIAEEWAPASRNMTYEFKGKNPLTDKLGLPLVTVADSSNPWWLLLQDAVNRTGSKLGKPEIFPAATDSRFVRLIGVPAFGLSPMGNTPVLLHDHNEFLNKREYLKGIKVYEAVIESLTAFGRTATADHTACDEL